MIYWLMKKRGYEKLDKIIIPEDFRKHPPTMHKMNDKWLFYEEYQDFQDEIVINKNNVLKDGYTTYLMACRLGKKYMKVRRIYII